MEGALVRPFHPSSETLKRTFGILFDPWHRFLVHPDTIARIPNYKTTKVDELLPWRWKG
jgi:hypothetical protein